MNLKSTSEAAMKARWPLLLVVSVILVTNGISVRFVTHTLTSAHHQIVIEKREMIDKQKSAFTTDKDLGTARQTLFEVETAIALSVLKDNLIAAADVFIFVGILLAALAGWMKLVTGGDSSTIRAT